MDTLIRFFIDHNERIIFFAAAAIGLFSAIVVWWQVFGKKGLKTEAHEIDLTSIEESLKKILNQTHVAIGSVVAEQSNSSPAEGASEKTNAGVGKTDGVGRPAGVSSAATSGGASAGGVSGASAEELSKLKTELEQRAKLIEDLKAQVTKAKEAATAELIEKIKTLEGRLAEYEVIEDDIADLSRYKEENAKLKSELEALKRASPEMVDQFAEALAQADVSASQEEGPVAEPIASAVSTESAASAEPTEPAVFAEPAEAATVGAAEATTDVAEAVAPINVPETNSSLSEPQKEQKVEAKGDIFAEFSGGEGLEDDPLSALGDIDPDRMLDELKDLNADLDVGVEALNEKPDIDKLAEEAENLGEAKKG